MNKSVDKLCDYFSKAINTDSGKMNIKEVAMGFTIDVIASTSFGTVVVPTQHFKTFCK